MRNDPARKLEPSLELVADLEKHGVDVGEDHAVEHFFVGSLEQAMAVAEMLGEAGHTVSKALNSQTDEDFSVLLSQPLDSETLTKTIFDACQIAEAHGLGYDGWDADVSRWQLKGQG